MYVQSLEFRVKERERKCTLGHKITGVQGEEREREEK